MTAQEYNKAVKEWSGRLYGYLLKSTRSHDDANDIVQEGYLKLWENRKKVEFEKSKSWLFTTAHRIMLNKIKKDSRMVPLNGNRVNGINGHNGHARIEPSTESWRQFELREIIDKCLEKLPPVQKSIILLRDLEGYNYKEIGDILELTESQVKVYLFRGRKKIKNQLKDLTVLI